MKVELQSIRLAKSGLTDNVYAGIPAKSDNKWLQKVDVTNDFISAVIARWENQKEVIQSGINKWEITVKKLKS